jgi:protein-tyrosine phosphatase
MIDIHCHILFDTDDGAHDMSETMEMCSIAEKDGIKTIIATPHYIEGQSCNDNINDKILAINEELKSRSMDISLFPGNEIYLALDSYKRIEQGECFSLNHSRYVLVEFSMMNMPKFISDALYNLRVKEFVPIIAHPERNCHIIEKPQWVYDYIMEGCLIQINSTSLTGASGKEVQKTAELLLKHNMVHFIASDAHSSKHRIPVLSKAYSCADNIGGPGTGEKLICGNPRSVINDEDIKIEEPIKVKKRNSFINIFRK